MNINRKEFMDMIIQHAQRENPEIHWTKKEIEVFYEAFIKVMETSLEQGNRIFFSGFGSFFVKKRASTIKTNPQDPSIKFQVPAKNAVKFKPSNKLNDIIN